MSHPGDLYHVTYLFVLPAIRDTGLQPGSGQVFGGGFAGHSRGRVFLADWAGVDFWVMRYGELADHHTDTPQDGWVPVVLEVNAAGLKLSPDEAGTDDSGANSYYSEAPIPPERVAAVWDGDAWVALDDVDVEAMLNRALAAADTETEDGVTLYYMDYDVFKPDDD
jgi:hypothetical protein